MSPTKSQPILVFLTALVVWAIFTPQSSLAGGSGEITDASGATMRSGYLIVRLSSTQAALAAVPTLPEGLRFHSRVLSPAQTELYGNRLGTRKLQDRAQLYALEDRLVRTLYVTYAGPIHPVHAARTFAKFSSIELAEPWYVGELHAAPNDPLVVEQNALTTMRMAQAWDVEQGDPNVVIGISDNGVDQTHEDLKGSLWTNTAEVPNNFIDDDGNGVVDDYQGANFTWEEDGTQPGNTTNNRSNGHGTKVAGIAGAQTNNGIGIAGVAWKCRIFPIKTARVDGGGIIYGYQSLIYAAQMGFRVVNTSWGIVKPFSPIDQDVVNYCLERGTLIVASAGNHGDGTGASGWNLLNFPSAYDGVLGVGETSSSDAVIATSGLGLNAQVMAPGNRATATISGGGYSSSGVTGTSFASPMAAGVAALIASHYPGLGARQVAAVIERESDNIAGVNPEYAPVLPGRINAERALATVPFSAPGLRISGVEKRFPDGRIANRYDQGDTLDITYQIANDLGGAESASFTLGISQSNDWSVSIVTGTLTVGAIPTNGTVAVGPFRVILSGTTLRPCILSLAVSGSPSYAARLLDYLNRSSVMKTFENEQLIFSAGEDGTFGYNNSLISRNGTGFSWKTGYGLISPSGFILSEGGSRALKAFDNLNNISDFTIEKPFDDPEPDRAVMSDVNSPKSIGLRISQHVSFPSPSATTTLITIGIENRSASPLTDVSAGYFFDWDIGFAGQNNSTRLAMEAIPTTFRETGVAQAFEREDVPVSVVCAAVSNELQLKPQASGMMLNDMVDDGDGFTDQDAIALLNSGTSIQTASVGDACGSVGMLFPGTLAPGDKRVLTIVIGVGATTDEAATAVRETILNPNSVGEASAATFTCVPQPANDEVSIVHSSSVKSIRLIDVAGREVLSRQIELGQTQTVLPVALMPNGVYVAVVETTTALTTRPLLIVHP